MAKSISKDFVFLSNLFSYSLEMKYVETLLEKKKSIYMPIYYCINRVISDDFRQANQGVELYSSQLKKQINKLRILQNSAFLHV